MKVIKRYNQHRRDLTIDMQCENCGYEDTYPRAYDDKREAWENAKESSVKFVKNHNNNCKCGVKMTLGSF